MYYGYSKKFSLTRIKNGFRKLQMAELGYISESKRKIYLFCYNLFMMRGYIYVVAIMNLRYAKLGFDDFVPKVYNLIGNSVKMLSLLSVLEVLHPMFGYTKVSILLIEIYCAILSKNFCDHLS